MTRAIGIDPGTVSFDLCGLEHGHLFLDESIRTSDVASDPRRLVDLLQRMGPVDLIIGPSGYGLPWVNVQEMGPKEKGLLLLNREQSPTEATIIGGLGRVLDLLKESGLPVRFAPAVIHLPTVPAHRKVNRIDMGTADKVCAVVLGVYDQARHLDIAYDETSFFYVELGGAFTAIIAVDGGRIVDGMGGTSGTLGYRSCGAMDGELACALGDFPKGALGSGGVSYIAGRPDAPPERLIASTRSDPQCHLAWEAFVESLVKGVVTAATVVPSAREILLSGRLCRVPAICRRVESALRPFGPVRRVRGFAHVAKEAAQGAALIAEGLAGGKYERLVDAMQLRDAGGTVLDHLYVAGVEALRDDYLGQQGRVRR
ncbi:MAG: DUF1464 family protein [Anaerolineae bacterium]|jgi:predicted butyrate kinase (DUF1464 family)